MQVKIDITSATIFRPRNGMDQISLTTSIPSLFPTISKEPFCLQFPAPKGKGEEILAGLFPGVEYTLIEAPKDDYKFSRGGFSKFSRY